MPSMEKALILERLKRKSNVQIRLVMQDVAGSRRVEDDFSSFLLLSCMKAGRAECICLAGRLPVMSQL